MFTPAPILSFRSAKKIKDYLVRAKLYPLEWNVGSIKFSKSKCAIILEVQISFLAVTGVTYKINHYFNCDSKCLVYLITCCAFELKYTGQTCNVFQKCNYRCYARKAERGEECKQKYLYEHYLQDDHHGVLNDAQVTLIDKTQTSYLTKRNYFWMRTLKTY